MKLLEWLEDRTYDLRLRWIDKNTEAEINYLNEVIRINLELILAKTIVHEFLHDQYPDLSEKEIIAKTRKYLNRMKVLEIKKVARLTFRQMIFKETPDHKIYYIIPWR